MLTARRRTLPPRPEDRVTLVKGARHMRLSTAVEEYLTDMRAARKSEETIVSYRSDLGRLVSLARGTHGDSLLSFTPDLVRRYLLEMSMQGLKQATLHKRRSCISGFAKWCLMRRLVADDPMAQAPRIKRPKRVPRAYAEEALDALLALPLTGDEHVMRGLMYFAGLRVSEVCNLRVPDVILGGDEAAGRLIVHGKGDKQRAVPIVPDLWHILRDHLLAVTDLVEGYRSKDGGPYLLQRPMGTPHLGRHTRPGYTRRMVERRVRQWGRAVGAVMIRQHGFNPFQGERFTPHRFRHSFCTDMLLSGADLREVQEAAGHEDISTTAGYLEATAQRIRAAVHRLSRRDKPGKVSGEGSAHQRPAPPAGTGGVVQRTDSDEGMGRRAEEGL